MRAAASIGREVVRAGPFTVTISAHDPMVHINYAIPDAGADPTPQDIAELEAAFTSRSRTPRLEYLPGLAPLVEPALLAAGFTVTDRLPLMQCPPGATIDQPLPDGIELVTPTTDAELHALLAAQHEAFGAPPPTDEHLAAARTGNDIRLLARTLDSDDVLNGFGLDGDGGRGGGVDGGDSGVDGGGESRGAGDGGGLNGGGEPAGGGVAVAVRDGMSEVAGIAVRPKFERRGIGAALTLHLTRAAHAAGAELVYLTPGGDAQERLYARVGYRRTDSVLFLTKEVP
jgi:ribosomal protein S18 acetylase RimI-like enzyme